MTDFNDLSAVRKLDKSDMLLRLLEFPGQILEGIENGYATDISAIKPEGVANIVVVGMGGSAIGGDLAKSYLDKELKLPMIVHRDYSLPAYVGADSLVFAISYSGNTEETLSAYGEARERGARIVVISSGGEISVRAEADGAPLVRVPSGYAPRAALGHLFFPILILLSRMGFCKVAKGDLVKVSSFLKGRVPLLAPESPENDNPAKQIARKLFDRIPIIYSAREYYEPVAVRFRGQIAENSKVLAFSNVFPEFNHNELVGYEKLTVANNKLIVLMMRDPDEHSRIQKRMEIISELLSDKGIEVVNVEATGQVLLEKIFSLIQLVDFCSFYLAMLNDQDPSPVQLIEHLKRALADSC